MKMKMHPLIKNLLFSAEGRALNPLVHLFLYITLAFGVSFLFLADPSGASGTILYSLTTVYFGNLAACIWGFLCILVTVLNTISFMFRPEWLGPKVTYLGALIWLYSFVVFTIGGFWFGAFVLSLPNMIFWLWHHNQVKLYYKNYHSGIYPRLKDKGII